MKSNLSKALDRHLKMHIVRRDLQAIQTEKKDYNRWIAYIYKQLSKLKIK